MFKEIVSLAIILGFIWNIIYVEHPDSRSYTIAFVGSLVVLAAFGGGWICWREVRNGASMREVLRWRYWKHLRGRVSNHEAENDSEIRLGLMSGVRSGTVSDVGEGIESRASADLEKGLGSSTTEAES
ncbi:hypothetical protein VTL71DRAFT_7877 [Oculimacula yallundae]|uniref:Uncharacterized protein n=1 Tax=Oculimacula yallundae TaxID=86028 RepID=A0ABR4CW12_9HELO